MKQFALLITKSGGEERQKPLCSQPVSVQMSAVFRAGRTLSTRGLSLVW